MKKLKSIFAIGLLIVFFTSCEKLAVEAAGANCEANRTSVVTFENHSTNHTYTIVWNNSEVATLGPGEKSKPRAYAAGHHTYSFINKSNGKYYCQPSYPNLAQCYSYVFYCDN